VVVVRSIVRHNTKEGCAKRVKVKEREGWKDISGIKEDTSHISWGEISYVCVMEKADNEEHKAKNQHRRFNRFYRQD
jgi:hypothetical protein